MTKKRELVRGALAPLLNIFPLSNILIIEPDG
jgi:hypothetical protein